MAGSLLRWLLAAIAVGAVVAVTQHCTSCAAAATITVAFETALVPEAEAPKMDSRRA